MRLLVIRLGALGDLLHMSPSIQAVKQAYPDVEVHLLTGPLYQDFATGLPGVDRVWCLNKQEGWPGLFYLANTLKRVGIDGVINLHPSFKTWLLAQWVRPKQQTVYHKEKFKIKGQAQRSIARRHAAADFYEPFRRFFGLVSHDPLLPRFNQLSLSVNLLRKVKNERWIGIIPGVGAKRSNRAWEPDAYVELIRQLLREPDRQVALIGGPDERLLADRLLNSLADYGDRIENHCGRHDIPETARLLAECDVVVGGDTGPMHLAAAVGVPLVGIYGPTSLMRTGPVGMQSMQLLTPPQSLACWPCELAECPLTGDDHLACMRQISMREVLVACEALLPGVIERD
jgi:ADP-heptose:LPS heptosyltransferase